MLVTKLREYTGVRVREERPMCIADDDQRIAAAHVAGVVAVTAVAVDAPIAVVAATRFEIRDISRRKRRGAIRSEWCDETEPNEIVASQRTRILHAEVRHERHAVVL